MLSRGDDQLRSSIVWLGPFDLRTCPPDTASILATTFFQPSLKFRNAVAFFGNMKAECTTRSLVLPSTLASVQVTTESSQEGSR